MTAVVRRSRLRRTGTAGMGAGRHGSTSARRTPTAGGRTMAQFGIVGAPGSRDVGVPPGSRSMTVTMLPTLSRAETTSSTGPSQLGCAAPVWSSPDRGSSLRCTMVSTTFLRFPLPGGTPLR